MAMQAQAPALLPGSRHHRSLGARLGPVLLTAEGVALVAVLLAADGSPLGRAVRAVAAAAMTGLAAWLMTRSGRTGRGAVALVAGIAGTVTGAGIASAQAKASISVTLLAALVALVAGVILLGLGGVLLVRAVPGWWRLLAVPAALALLVFVLFPLTIAVNATNRLPDTREPLTPASRGLAYRDVILRTSDGVPLAAWYVPSRNGAAVVLVPSAARPGPRWSATPPCWPGTATAPCWSIPAATAAAAGTPWTSAGTATGTSPQRCRGWNASQM